MEAALQITQCRETTAFPAMVLVSPFLDMDHAPAITQVRGRTVSLIAVHGLQFQTLIDAAAHLVTLVRAITAYLQIKDERRVTER
jgi:hypothetical protein